MPESDEEPAEPICLPLERIEALVREHVAHEEARREILALLEEVRAENAQLRCNEKQWRERAIW